MFRYYENTVAKNNFMVYSHYPEPRPGQEPGTSGLYETVWKHSHCTWTRTLRRFISSLIGPSHCLSPGSAQCEYTIMRMQLLFTPEIERIIYISVVKNLKY